MAEARRPAAPAAAAAAALAPAPARAVGDPGDRGTLTVDRRAIERIAAFTAAQVHGVVRDGSSWDRATARDLPHVTARTAGGRARLVVETAVVWPVALGEVCAAVRDAVADRVREAAAVEVAGVDVVVVKVVLPAAAVASRRVS